MLNRVLGGMLVQLKQMGHSHQFQRASSVEIGDLSQDLIDLLAGAGVRSHHVRDTLVQHDILDMDTFLLLEDGDLRELFPVMGTRLKLRRIIRGTVSSESIV